jgi:hypothetical protein
MKKLDMSMFLESPQGGYNDAEIRAGMRRAHQLRAQVFGRLISRAFNSIGHGIDLLRGQFGGSFHHNKATAK